jgi:hypothetical protein
MAKAALRTNVKFKRLCRILGLPPPHVWGLLDMMWVAGHARGRPEIGDAQDVEASAEWEGKPGELTEALREAGFLDGDPATAGCYLIHDFWDHAPEYVQKRRKRQQEKAALPPPEALNGKGAAKKPALAVDDSPVLLVFPCLPGKKKNPNKWPMTRAFLDEQAPLFPGFDLLADAREALSYYLTHPGKRKTYEGMPAALNAWWRKTIAGQRGAGLQQGQRTLPSAAKPPYHSRELGK